MTNITETDPRIDRLKTLAVALMSDSSDWRAGIGALLREIEAHEPGFIQRIAAVDQLRRLGLSTREPYQ